MTNMRHEGSHRVPVLGEVIGVVEEEVSAVDMDEGPQVQVLGAVALLPHQLLVSARHMEVLHTGMHVSCWVHGGLVGGNCVGVTCNLLRTGQGLRHT